MAAPLRNYVGVGYAIQSATGDLDGKGVAANDTGDHAVYLGKPESLQPGGYIVLGTGPKSGRWAIELIGASNKMMAKHNNAPAQGDANLYTQMLAARVNSGLSQRFDIFARAGFAGGVIEYSKGGARGSTSGGVFTPSSRTSAEIETSNWGFGWGLGMEITPGERVSLELSYSNLALKFDSAKVISQTFTFHPAAEHVTSTNAALVWHW